MLFSILLLSATAAAACACGAISQSCTMDSDLSSSGTCMNVTAPNVTIDCNGHFISGNGSGYGIYSNQSGTAIRGCTIGGFLHGVFINGGGNPAITGNRISTSVKDGRAVYVYKANGSNITGNDINSTGLSGIFLHMSGNAEIIGNNATISSLNRIEDSPAAIHAGRFSNDPQIFSANIIVRNNTIKALYPVGLAVLLWLDADNVTLSENDIFANVPGWDGFWGVRTFEISNSNFIRNTIRNPVGVGIYFQRANGGNLVEDNDILAGNSSLVFYESNQKITVRGNKLGSESTYPAIQMNQSSNHEIYNNTLYGNGTGIYLLGSSKKNLIYWNNFSSSFAYNYVNDFTNETNYLNTTINGHPEGNIYGNVMNGTVAVYGQNASAGFPWLYYGNAGAVPYNESNAKGMMEGPATDYAPLTPFYQANTPPWVDGISLAIAQWYPAPSGVFNYTARDSGQGTVKVVSTCYRNAVQKNSSQAWVPINVTQSVSGAMFGSEGTATNDAVYCCAQPFDGYAWGTSVCSNTSHAPPPNDAPNITALYLGSYPSTYYEGQGIYCYGNAVDDGLPSSGGTNELRFSWYRNGTLNRTAVGSWGAQPAVVAIPGSEVSAGDTWRCDLYAYDGALSSPVNSTPNITIQPALASCKAYKDADPSSADGIYTIDPDGPGGNTAFLAYCDQTYDGGGWTMLLKATAGTTFNYDANYWTTANTLNPANVTRENTDAKFRSFNELNVTSVMARWPDAGDMRWLKRDAWASSTALTGFNTFHNWGSPQEQPDWNSTYFSSQAKQCDAFGWASPLTGGPGMYGTKLADLGGCGGGSRWGYRFNENGCLNWETDDAGGGIGVRAACTIGPLASTGASAGDSYGCCGSQGMNRLARVEVYGREGYVGSVNATPSVTTPLYTCSSYGCGGYFDQGVGTQPMTVQMEYYINGNLTGSYSQVHYNYHVTANTGLGSSLNLGDVLTCKARATLPTGADSGWQTASATAQACPNQAPSTGTISPDSGAYYCSENPVQTFTATYTDPDGWDNIQYVNLLINYGIDGGNTAFYGKYDINANHAYIANDSGTGWLDAGAIGSLSETCNTYSCIEPSTSHSGSGNTLFVNWTVKMRNGWSEPSANMYLYAVDDSNTPASAGWGTAGAISIICNGNGASCSQGRECASSACRKEIDSSGYYCASSGSDCSENSGGHPGYPAGSVGNSSNSDWQCVSTNSSVQCHSGTACATYNSLYCNGAGTWASGTGSGVSVANCDSYVCSGQTIQRHACNGAGSCTAQGSLATCAGTACSYCSNGSASCILPGEETVCRASAGDCDPPEYCDGAGGCTGDSRCGSGYKYAGGASCTSGSCRPSAGACDYAEECDGVAVSCPSDAKVPAGTLCSGNVTWSGSNGACNATRTYNNCDGASNSCPSSNPGTQTQYASAGGQVWWGGGWVSASCSQYCSMTGANGCSGQQTTTSAYGCAAGSSSCSVAAISCGTGTYCQGTDSDCGCIGGSCTNCAAGGYVCSAYSCVMPALIPSGLAASAMHDSPLVSQHGGINISWEANDNPEGTRYHLEETSPAQQEVYVGESLSYAHTGLDDNTRYCYRVRAYRSNYSNYTPTACAATLDRTSPQPQNTLPGKRGLVGYWNFDEGSGSYAHDSAYGNTGTLDLASGSGWTASGRVNGALYLNQGDGGSAANDVVVVPDSDLIDLDVSKSFTLSIWVHPMQYACASMMRKEGQFDLFRCAGPDGGITIALWQPGKGDYTGSIPISDNQWSHIAVAYDKPSATLKMYVNKALAGTWTEIGGTPSATGGQLGIGAHPGGLYSFKGIIDEAKLYNRALPEAEISEEHTPLQAQISTTEGGNGLVLYMPFEEGTGSSTADWSPFSNDGTLNGVSLTAGNGEHGNAAAFSASNQQVKVQDSPSLDFGTGDFTVELWFYKNRTTSSWYPNGLANKWNTGASPGTNEWLITSGGSADNVPSFGIENGTTSYWAGSTGNITLNTWVHVAGVRRGGSLELYIDGRLNNSATIGAIGVNNVGRNLSIGRLDGAGSYGHSGYIDEVRIYNRSLTQREIMNDMQSGLIRKGIYAGTSASGSYAPSGGSFHDFESGSPTGWMEGRGKWSVEEYGGHHYAYALLSDEYRPMESIIWEAPSLSNYAVEAEIYSSDSSSSDGTANPGVIFHAVDTDNYNLAFFRPYASGEPSAVQCAYVTSGTLVATAQANATIPHNAWFNAKLVVNDGGAAKVYVNDVYAITCPNSRGFAGGAAGVWNHDGMGAYDNFRVTPLLAAPNYTDSSATDTSAPSAGAAPSINATSATTIHAEWGSEVTRSVFGHFFPDNGNTYYYYSNSLDLSGNWESLAANPGFERGQESWSTAGYANISSPQGAYNGAGALYIGYNGGSWAGISQCKRAGQYELGAWYRAEAKYRCSSGESQIFFGDDANYGIYAKNASAQCTGNWETISVPLFLDATQPGNGTFCIYLYGHNSQDGVYYDDVKWHKLKNVTVTSGVAQYYLAGPGTGANQWYTSSNATVSGLAPNTQHCYTVKAADQASNVGAETASGCATTPPATPSGLTAVALSNQPLNSHLGAISVTWNTNGNPAGTVYNVFVNSSLWSSGAYNGAINISGGSIADNTQYCIKVRATGTGGTTGFSNEACATTIDRSAPTPDPATIQSVTPTSYQNITVIATTATEPHSPPVYYNISRISPSYASSGWQANATWADTGLTGSTQYCYKVQYKDDLGNAGSLSSQSCATTLNAPPTCAVSCTPAGVHGCTPPCTGDPIYCSMQGNDTESPSLNYSFVPYLNGNATASPAAGSIANGGWVYYDSPTQTAAGTFTLVFNVTDGNSQTASCTSNPVSVTPRPDTCPIVTSAYITPGSLVPNQGFSLRAVAVDNDGYKQLINFAWILKKNTAGVQSGTATNQSGADIALAKVPNAFVPLPLSQGDCYSCTVKAYDGTSCTDANAPGVDCGNYCVGGNSPPTLDSISLSPACIKTGTVTVNTAGFGDPNGDTTYLQVGTSSAGSDICNVAASTCSFQAQSFYTGTGANTVHARAYDGISASPGVTASFNTDNAGPSTAPAASAVPASSSSLYVSSSHAPGQISDTGCAGMGATPYQFTRNGTTLSWQAGQSFSDTGLLPHTTYCYTVRYRDAFGNVGAASSPSCAMTNNSAPGLASITASPSCVKAGMAVTVATQGASDPEGDALALRAGTSSGASDLCNSTLGSPERSCTFTAGWQDTIVHAIYGRAADGYGGVSGEANTASEFMTDNSGPATTARITSATPVGTAQISVAAPEAGAISDAGCAGMGALAYNFSRVGGASSGWQASNTWAATGLLPHTEYCFTVQYQDALGNAGAASSQVCNNTTNTAPAAPSNINPNGGQNFVGAASNSIAISWTGSFDPDGDAVTYAVEYSSNSGSSWNALGSTANTSYAWNSAASPSLCTYRVRVKAGDSYGGVSSYVSSASDFCITHNTAPTIPEITLTPSVPYTSDDLNCSIRPVDSEQAALNASVQWYKDGALMPLLNSTFGNIANNTLTRVATLGKGNLTAGSFWHCRVSVSDGTVASSWSPSSGVTVLQGCAVLSTPGATYSLSADLSATSTCFNVTASDVEINCSGKRLTGNWAEGVFGVYSSATGTKVHNCTFVNFVNAINLNGASMASIYNNTFICANGTHLNISASSGSNSIYLNSFTATSGAYVSDLNGGNRYNTSLSGQGEGNLYANVLDGSVPIFGSSASTALPAYNIGSSGGGYPYSQSSSGGKFACDFANCADYAPLIPKLLASYTCRISPDAPYASDTLQGYAGAPSSLESNVTYYYRWYMNNSLNCTGDEASVHVG